MAIIKQKKNVYIIGCSNTGSYIASTFSERGYNCYIIDKDPQAFSKLRIDYSGFKITGDASDTDFLSRNIGKDAYLVFVSTASDNLNCFIAQYLKKVMGIKFVLTRLYDADQAVTMEGSGIEIIYPSILTCDRFFEIVSEHEKGEEK